MTAPYQPSGSVQNDRRFGRYRSVKIRGVLTATAVVGAMLWPCAPIDAANASITIPSSIAHNCSKDVTAKINAWIAAAPANATLTFVPNGCYRVDGKLLVRHKSGLTIDGKNATFRAYTSGRELPPSQARTRSMWNFWRGDRLTVRNIKVIGPNRNRALGKSPYVLALEGQAAFVVGGVQTMLMERVQAYDVYGDFVHVGAATNGLLVRHSTFARNGRQGWNIAGTNITFDSNSISETARATIDMEPPSRTAGANHIVIKNNKVGGGRLYFFASVGLGAPINDVQILNNTLERPLTMIVKAPADAPRTNYVVAGNVSTKLYGGNGGSFGFINVHGIDVRDNVQPVAKYRKPHGVALKDSRDASITNNTFVNAEAPVLDRGGNTNVTQSGNLTGTPATVYPASMIP
jgi:hypothetical protein